MKNGKYQNGKSAFNVRPIAIMLAVALLIGASIGGTIAWLTASTEKVENTFTVGDVAIRLEERAYDPNDTDAKLNDTVDMQNNYPMIPGTTYFKDPTVYVEANSEKCYLFVKVIETNNPSYYLDYEYNTTGWTTNDNTLPDDVWCRVVDKSATEQSWNLLTDNKVAIKTTVVKKGSTPGAGEIEMPADSAQPKLEFIAYAIQFDNTGTAAEAWAKIPGNS